MRFEGLRQFHFESYQIRRPVGILLTAEIAAYFQSIIDLRRSFEGIGLAQRNFVSAEDVLMIVELTVLTDDDPEVLLRSLPGIPVAHGAPHDSTVTAKKRIDDGKNLIMEPSLRAQARAGSGLLSF